METYHHIYSSRSPSSQSPSSRSPSSVVGDGGAGLEEEERCGRGREGKDGHKEPGHKVYIIYYITYENTQKGGTKVGNDCNEK